MAEFHKNQIMWQAPEAQKVKLAQPNYGPMVDSLNNLADAADKWEGYIQGVRDVDAKETMDQTTADALTRLQRHDPSDNNYGPAMEEFEASIKGALDSFDDDTRNRFMRDNPTFFDAARLRADEIIFDKQQKWTITKVGKTIPLMASNVTEGITPYAQARAELDNMVAGLDRATAEELITTFDRDVQNANINNLIYGGNYKAAIQLLESPENSDLFTATERTEKKMNIQRIMEAEAKERARLKKEAESEADSELENNLVKTLLYAMDQKDDSYFNLQKLLDDPEATIKLTDDKGKTIGHITTKDIPVLVRRDAMKKARTYEEDSMTVRVQSLKANELADSLEKQYANAQGTRTSGEKFNQMYEFANSEMFYALDKTRQGKIQKIIDDAVNTETLMSIPYESFRDETLLYGVGKKWEGPSPAKMVRSFTFGKEGDPESYELGREEEGLEAAQKNLTTFIGDYSLSSEKPFKENAKAAAKIARGLVQPTKVLPVVVQTLKPLIPTTNGREDIEQRSYRQMSAVGRAEYQKRTGEEVRYGSRLEYAMNIKNDLLATKPEDRVKLGLEGVTDYQISLAYKIIEGGLEANNVQNEIIGQNMTPERANQIRREVYDAYYSVLQNGEKPKLSIEQQTYRDRQFSNLATGTVGTGGAPLSFTSTGYSMHKEPEIYRSAKELTNSFWDWVKKTKKGEE